MAEAHAEHGHAALGDRLADRGLLVAQPRVEVLLPDVHRPAHHDERGEVAQVRDRLAGVELDGAPCEAVLAQELAQNARMLDRDVLEHEDVGARQAPS